MLTNDFNVQTMLFELTRNYNALKMKISKKKKLKSWLVALSVDFGRMKLSFSFPSEECYPSNDEENSFLLVKKVSNIELN